MLKECIEVSEKSGKNKHGQTFAFYNCPVCKKEFSATPKLKPDKRMMGCVTKECSNYWRDYDPLYKLPPCPVSE